MYAMAINGHTDDSYGEYVKSTLAKLGKEDLRLLRNYLFALNGYVFKDVALTAIFDKQVWYQAEEKKR
ncbi:MAG TPA: YARHG domain-containing protein [Treponema sp.]|nr:YARHG domain-containing protein [Treponema sp.]HKL84839.1 YARHG domain-containing protein [Treponemataceae bacterium]